MTKAAIHFYSSDFCREGYETCVRDGSIVGAIGTLNLLWEDFSAVKVAEELGLSEVARDAAGTVRPAT